MKKILFILGLVALLAGCTTNPVVHTEYHKDKDGNLVKYTVRRNEGCTLYDEELKEQAAPVIAYMRYIRENDVTINTVSFNSP